MMTPPSVSGAPLVVSSSSSMAANLVGWSLATLRAARSPVRTCTGAATGADWRTRSPGPCGGADHLRPSQDAHGVHRRNEEAGDQVGGWKHVEELGEHGAVEHRGPGVHVGHLTRGQVMRDVEPGGFVHPAVHGEDEERPDDSRQGDRDQRGQVELGREASPAVEVDAEEDGLQEEGDAFERKWAGR